MDDIDKTTQPSQFDYAAETVLYSLAMAGIFDHDKDRAEKCLGVSKGAPIEDWYAKAVKCISADIEEFTSEWEEFGELLVGH